MNKKDQLSAILFKAYKIKTESLVNLDFNSDETVKTFINDRLIDHGRNGYMFHAEKHYKQVLYQTNWEDKSIIVDYILHCNSFMKRGRIKMTTKSKDLYCIQVNHTTFEDGKQSDIYTTYITFTRFKRSFVDEKWDNEYRSNPKYTLFGQQFTTTTVNYSDTDYSIRQFIFPDSIETAEQLHELHKPDQS